MNAVHEEPLIGNFLDPTSRYHGAVAEFEHEILSVDRHLAGVFLLRNVIVRLNGRNDRPIRKLGRWLVWLDIRLLLIWIFVEVGLIADDREISLLKAVVVGFDDAEFPVVLGSEISVPRVLRMLIILGRRMWRKWVIGLRFRFGLWVRTQIGRHPTRPFEDIQESLGIIQSLDESNGIALPECIGIREGMQGGVLEYGAKLVRRIPHFSLQIVVLTVLVERVHLHRQATDGQGQTVIVTRGTILHGKSLFDANQHLGVNHVVGGDISREEEIGRIVRDRLLDGERNIPLCRGVHDIAQVHDESNSAKVLGFAGGNHVILADAVTDIELHIEAILIGIVDILLLVVGIINGPALVSVDAALAHHVDALFIDKGALLFHLGPLLHGILLATERADHHILVIELDARGDSNNLFGGFEFFALFEGWVISVDDVRIDCFALIDNFLDIAIVLGHDDLFGLLEGRLHGNLHRGREGNAELVEVLASNGVALNFEVLGDELHNGEVIHRRVAQLVVVLKRVQEVAGDEVVGRDGDEVGIGEDEAILVEVLMELPTLGADPLVGLFQWVAFLIYGIDEIQVFEGLLAVIDIAAVVTRPYIATQVILAQVVPNLSTGNSTQHVLMIFIMVVCEERAWLDDKPLDRLGVDIEVLLFLQRVKNDVQGVGRHHIAGVILHAQESTVETDKGVVPLLSKLESVGGSHHEGIEEELQVIHCREGIIGAITAHDLFPELGLANQVLTTLTGAIHGTKHRHLAVIVIARGVILRDDVRVIALEVALSSLGGKDFQTDRRIQSRGEIDIRREGDTNRSIIHDFVPAEGFVRNAGVLHHLLELDALRVVILGIEDLKIGQLSREWEVHDDRAHDGVGRHQLALVGLVNLAHPGRHGQIVGPKVVYRLIRQILLLASDQRIADVEVIVSRVGIFAILTSHRDDIDGIVEHERDVVHLGDEGIVQDEGMNSAIVGAIFQHIRLLNQKDDIRGGRGGHRSIHKPGCRMCIERLEVLSRVGEDLPLCDGHRMHRVLSYGRNQVVDVAEGARSVGTDQGAVEIPGHEVPKKELCDVTCAGIFFDCIIGSQDVSPTFWLDYLISEESVLRC